MATEERERLGVETIAKHFAAAWKACKLPHDATLTIAGRRIAVAVLATGQHVGAAPRLRYDKVALRFMRDVEAVLSEDVPRGKTAMLTISAPIRLAGKTVAAVQSRVQAQLASASDGGDAPAAVLGNEIRVRILTHGSKHLPTAIVFVHTATAHADFLLEATQAMLAAIAAKARAAARGAGARWLVLADRDAAMDIAVCRHVHARLPGLPFERVLIVHDGGRVEALTP